jgi:hypothetical protein
LLAAQRFGKVPAGKRLRIDYRGGDLEVRLEEAPPGTDLERVPVPIPTRISRLKLVARRFRDRTDQHEVSRATLSRCVRIVNALAVEAERRGYLVASVEPASDRSGRMSWSGSNDGHLLITIRGHIYRLRISEEKVRPRGAWEREARWRANARYGGQGRLERYDAAATGRLKITVNGGYSREGRPASWADRKSWTLEEKLPDLLRELEVRAAEDDERDSRTRQEAEERQRRWEIAMERAKERFIEAHRGDALRAQVAAWQEANAIRAYLNALEEVHGDRPSAAEWIAWIRDHLDSLDPLLAEQCMPEAPEPGPEDLKPFLDGLSPYGPSRW